MALPVPWPTDSLIQQKTGIGHKRDLWTPSSFDYTVHEDSFAGDAIRGEYHAAVTNGTSAAATFTEGNSNNYLELVSGTDDDGYAGQPFALAYTGTRGLLFESIVKTPSAVTTMKLECGMTDAVGDAGAVLLKATPTHTATDYAVFVVDTDDDANIAFICYDGSTTSATQDIQAVAASTTYRFAIRIDATVVTGFINGKQVGQGVITAATKLTPWCFVQARTVSASRTIQWHKWRVTYPAY